MVILSGALKPSSGFPGDKVNILLFHFRSSSSFNPFVSEILIRTNASLHKIFSGGIFNLSGWMSGLKLGLLTGFCFAFTSMAINMLYEKKPTGLYFINGGYQLLGNIIAPTPFFASGSLDIVMPVYAIHFF